MNEEVIIVACPELNRTLAERLMRDATKGFFSNQSPPSMAAQVIIKLEDNEPKEIMCPRYQDGKCKIYFDKPCTYSSWSILKVKPKEEST